MKKKELVYCIGLFLAHAERYGAFFMEAKSNQYPMVLMYQSWFNASSDHLYDLQTRRITNKKLRERVEKWKEKCLDLGHGQGLMDGSKVTEEDMVWAITEAKDILAEIDEKMLGVKVLKGCG